jgi:penicillin amidase
MPFFQSIFNSLLQSNHSLDQLAQLSQFLQVADQGLTGARGVVRDVLSFTGLHSAANLPGLTNRVTVSREPSGIVHIQAQTEDDLFYTLGFMHANDRLWQMDFQRRVAQGRLSEIAGEATLQQDITNRTLGLYQAAASAYANLDPTTRRIVNTYTSGINAYLRLDRPLPLEFQVLNYRPDPWQPIDVLGAIKLQSLVQSGNFQSELLRSRLQSQGIPFARIQEIFPPYTGDVTILRPQDVAAIPGLPASNSPVLPQIDLSALAMPVSDTALERLSSSQLVSPKTFASNNWVVSGSRTTTGKPFLANDPHITLQIPSVWYAAHLEAPSYEAIGATLPGLPGVVIGRNNFIAWGATTTQADVQDLYALVEVPNQPGQYLYRNQLRPYSVRYETIKVRGEADVVLPIRESVYGPVISDALEIPQPLALQFVSLGPTDNTIAAFQGINRARNWTEFTTALQNYVAPIQNFVYADVNGNIGYYAPGKIPIRQTGHSGLLPVPGTGQFDWQGFIPFNQLPQMLNPDSGFIVTANNRVAPDNYPYFISQEWAEPYRAERIRQLILSKDRLSLDDMQAIQLDQTTLLYRDFKLILQQLQPILSRLNPVPTETLNWLNQLLSWDGNLRPDSRVGTVFEAWFNELTKFGARAIGLEVLEGNAQEPAPRFLLKALTLGDPALGGSATQALTNAALTLQRVVEGFRGNVPQWGDIHQAAFRHPVLPIRRQVPYGGDRYTINVGPYNSTNFLMDRNGPSYRQLIDLSNPERSRYIYAIGQSGRFFSPYFDNLLEPWRRGQYLAMKTENFPVATRLTLRPETHRNGPVVLPEDQIEDWVLAIAAPAIGAIGGEMGGQTLS